MNNIADYTQYSYNYDTINIIQLGYSKVISSRIESLKILLREAWELYVKGKNISNKLIIKTISSKDQYNMDNDYCFGIASEFEIDECFPNFVFDKWEDAKIYDYQITFNELVEEGKTPPIDNRAFWIGSTVSHYSRTNITDLTLKYPEIIDFRSYNWNDINSEFVSLKEHCKYGCLVDVRGFGHSGRLPLLLATGRPVIITTRKYEQWFYHDGTFQPWVHYIPSGEKYGELFSHDELVKSVKWVIEHPEEAAQIGKNGQEYAKKYLTRETILKRIGDILLKDLA